jgi:hypothetical protein
MVQWRRRNINVPGTAARIRSHQDNPPYPLDYRLDPRQMLLAREAAVAILAGVEQPAAGAARPSKQPSKTVILPVSIDLCKASTIGPLTSRASLKRC